MNLGQLEDARRRALNILETWIDATGVIPKDSGYYYELQSVIGDAVECGAQAACGIRIPLEGEQ